MRGHASRLQATEVVSQGRYALAKVLSNAQAAYCRVTAKGNTVLATADAAVDATLSAVAEILMTTLQRVSGVSSAGGEASLACSGGSTHATLKVGDCHARLRPWSAPVVLECTTCCAAAACRVDETAAR
jgi:hypothetical protein